MKFVALAVIALSFTTATSSPSRAEPVGNGGCTTTDNGCTKNTEGSGSTCCVTTDCPTVKTKVCTSKEVTVKGTGAPAQTAPITKESPPSAR